MSLFRRASGGRILLQEYDLDAVPSNAIDFQTGVDARFDVFEFEFFKIKNGTLSASTQNMICRLYIGAVLQTSTVFIGAAGGDPGQGMSGKVQIFRDNGVSPGGKTQVRGDTMESGSENTLTTQFTEIGFFDGFRLSGGVPDFDDGIIRLYGILK